MKTNIYKLIALAVSAVTLLAGCTNPEVEQSKAITITLNPSTILSGFIPFDSSDFEVYSDSKLGDSKLRITCLLYDNSGRLVKKAESLLSDYDKTVSFKLALESGTYRLIALASNILGTIDSPEYEAYSITGIEQLEQLQVEQVFDSSLGSSWSVLGYSSGSINTADNEVFVNMEPATSLIYLLWKDIHANANIDDYYIIYHCNNIMKFSSSGAPIYTTNLSSTENCGEHIEPANYSENHNRIYSTINLFPGSFNLFARTFVGNNSADYSRQTVTVESGHQYVFTFDCSSLNLTASESTLKSGGFFNDFDKAAEHSSTL